MSRLDDFMYDVEADANKITSEGHNVFHVLFTHKRDMFELVALTEHFIELGADPNQVDNRSITPTHELVNMKFTDDDLAALFALWFAQPDLDLSIKNAAGFTAIDLARKLPYRVELVKLMESYNAA